MRFRVLDFKERKRKNEIREKGERKRNQSERRER